MFSCKQNQLNRFAPVQLEFDTISKFLVENFRCSLFIDPLLEEIPTTSTGEEMDPKVLDLAMKIAEKMFLKMKEEDAKKKAEEEETRRKAEEDRGKGKIEYNDDLVELLVSRVMSKVSLTTEGSSTKSKGNKFNKVQFDYSRNFFQLLFRPTWKVTNS